MFFSDAKKIIKYILSIINFVLLFYYFYVFFIFIVFFHFFLPYNIIHSYFSYFYNFKTLIISQKKIWKTIKNLKNFYEFSIFFFTYVNKFYLSYLKQIFYFNIFIQFLSKYFYYFLPYSFIVFYEDVFKESYIYNILKNIFTFPANYFYLANFLSFHKTNGNSSGSYSISINKKYSENPPPLIVIDTSIANSNGTNLDSNGNGDYFLDSLSVPSATTSPSNYLYSKYNSNNLSSFSSTNSLNNLENSRFSHTNSSNDLKKTSSNKTIDGSITPNNNKPMKFSFSDSDLFKDNSSSSTTSKISSSSSYVFDNVFGVIPQETRDLWSDEKKRRKKLYNDLIDQEKDNNLPPIRYK